MSVWHRYRRKSTTGFSFLCLQQTFKNRCNSPRLVYAQLIEKHRDKTGHPDHISSLSRLLFMDEGQKIGHQALHLLEQHKINLFILLLCNPAFALWQLGQTSETLSAGGNCYGRWMDRKLDGKSNIGKLYITQRERTNSMDRKSTGQGIDPSVLNHSTQLFIGRVFSLTLGGCGLNPNLGHS